MDDETRRIIEELNRRPLPPVQATPEEWAAARQANERWHELRAQHDRGELTNRQYNQAWMELVFNTDPKILGLAARLTKAMLDALRGEMPPDA